MTLNDLEPPKIGFLVNLFCDLRLLHTFQNRGAKLAGPENERTTKNNSWKMQDHKNERPNRALENDGPERL